MNDIWITITHLKLNSINQEHKSSPGCHLKLSKVIPHAK